MEILILLVREASVHLTRLLQVSCATPIVHQGLAVQRVASVASVRADHHLTATPLQAEATALKGHLQQREVRFHALVHQLEVPQAEPSLRHVALVLQEHQLLEVRQEAVVAAQEAATKSGLRKLLKVEF